MYRQVKGIDLFKMRGDVANDFELDFGGALGFAKLPPQTLARTIRSEEHTSELQSHLNLVCRLLLEKKNKESRSKSTEDGRHTTHHSCTSTLASASPGQPHS